MIKFIDYIDHLFPQPEELILKKSIDLNSPDFRKNLIRFYKNDATKHNTTSYRLMRAVLQNYATQIMTQNATKHPTETRPST